MKTAKHIIIFLLLVFIGDQIISAVMTSLYKGLITGQSGGKTNYLLNNYKQVSILAVGNSRCAHHVVTSELGNNNYNLSHNGMSLIFHAGLINQLVNNENLAIDTILLNLELTELFYPKTPSERDIQHLKYYYDKNEWIKSKIRKIVENNRFSKKEQNENISVSIK